MTTKNENSKNDFNATSHKTDVVRSFYMTPKEKAQEIFNKFYFAQDKDGFHSMSKYRARECAYIELDEIIGEWEYIDTYLTDWNRELNPNLKYWYEVKKEVQKIPT